MTLPLFSLSATLEGHSQDVRALAASAGALFSGSRDTKVLKWIHNDDSPTRFSLAHSYNGHSHFVNSLLYLPPTEEFPEGLIASGSADKSINVFDPRKEDEPVFSLIDHSDTVCTLALDSNTGAIISGSWDKTAKIWINWECVTTLTGHAQAVWAVMSAGKYGVLTASADNLIKLWKDGKCVRTLSGHTDAVRALAPLEGVGFISASNDSTIRVWSFDGDCLAELYAHTSFVYGLAVLPSGGFASCGEDRTVRVWKAEGAAYKCVQTIQHPCTSVWCVAAFDNGDIASGGSDCVIRIFTTSDKRVASLEEIKAYDDAVAKQQIPSNQVGDVDKTKLPGPEALLQPGRPDQVIMVRNGDMVEAHQYNAAERQWVKIGEVIDAVGGGRKQTYLGREYDYVFEIDIGAGQNLKLPYNASENPYAAAQRFIDEHELNQDFLDQIGTFIINNSKGTATIGSEANSNFVDPFTGAGRYVPGSVPEAATPVTKSRENLFPHVYSTFGAINCKGVKTKISQLNSDPTKVGNLAFNSSDMSTINSLLEFVESGKQSVVANLTEIHWKAVIKIAVEWPEAARFPGIDLIRILVLYSSAPLSFEGDDLLPKIFKAAKLSTAFDVENEVNIMLAMRVVANLVGSESGVDYLYKHRQMIVNALGYKWSKSTNANLRLAVSSVFLNLVIILKSKRDDSFSFDLLTSILEFLGSESDAENEQRILTALGTLLLDNKVAQEAAGLVDIKSVLRSSKNKGVERIRQLHGAILKK